MSNPNDFLLNTDYEMDKIILVETGSTIGDKNVLHTLGAALLAFGVWSTDPDFNTVNTIGVTDISLDPAYTPRLGVDCESLSEKIHLFVSGDGSDTTTIYYRIYCFAPPNSNINAHKTSNLSNTFILNTDYNYRKLMATGTFTQENQEFEHNLGYLPQVMAWDDTSGTSFGRGIYPYVYSSHFTGSTITVTSTKIKCNKLLAGEKIYWRIYHDKA